MKQVAGVLALGMVLALGGCDSTPKTPATDTGASVPVAAVDVPATPAATGPARLDGYGPLALGQTVAQVRAAWKMPLRGEVPDDYCHALRPEGAQADDVILMIEGQRLVRYDVRNARILAPGGGQVGMSLGKLQMLYPERGDLGPHKYDPRGHNLRVRPAEEGAAVLNFEIDGDGKVTAWRVGKTPQVDYVEGCG